MMMTDFAANDPDERVLFRDRRDAARHLAARLERYSIRQPLVLGIPRGGVVVAAEVARWMNADLDVAVARKLQAPGAPELALGAVTPDGARYVNQDVVSMLRVPDRYLEAETIRQVATAKQRLRFLRGADAPAPVEGRTVILVDDGLATGATMLAAVRSVRERRPARLIVAVPVASDDACQLLSDSVDELVCLHRPDPFYAVGVYYLQFDPVEDEEVRVALAAHQAPRAAPHIDTAGIHGLP